MERKSKDTSLRDATSPSGNWDKSYIIPLNAMPPTANLWTTLLVDTYFYAIERKVILNKRGYQHYRAGVSEDASLAKAAQNLYHEWILNLPPLSWTAAMPTVSFRRRGNYFQC